MSDDSSSIYTLWAILRRDPENPVTASDATELADLTALIEADGVTVRGFYDVSGLRADADLMVWLHGPDPQALQRDLRRRPR